MPDLDAIRGHVALQIASCKAAGEDLSEASFGYETGVLLPAADADALLAALATAEEERKHQASMAAEFQRRAEDALIGEANARRDAAVLRAECNQILARADAAERRGEAIRGAYDAAEAYINVNVCDQDTTAEMWEAWHKLLVARAALARAEEP